jgi:hypothetical protein
MRMPLDRPVLVGNLLAGTLCLLLLAILGAWPLSLVGAVYVVAASLFFAWLYGRDSLTVRQEAAGWALPWLGAVATWVWLLAAVSGPEPTGILPWVFGVVIGSGCYIAWQVLALAIRQVMAHL